MEPSPPHEPGPSPAPAAEPADPVGVEPDGDDDAGASPRLEPRRLHPLSPLFDLFDRNLLAPGILAFGSGSLRILAVAMVLLGVVRVVAWTRHRYVLEDGVLRVESGVLSRNEQLVPCDRIQQVNHVQKLRHRIFGVAALRVEVAGGGRGSGVELDVLGLEEASTLRAALLAAKAEVTAEARGEAPGATGAPGEPVAEGAEGAAVGEPGPQWVPTPWPVVRLTPGQLVIAGLTGSELFVVFAFAASTVQLVDGVPDRVRDLAAGLDGGLLTTGLLGLVFVAVWLGAAIATSVLRDAGYELDLVGDELHLSRGLLDRKQAVLPLARVQAVQVTASPLRRPLGYVSVRVQSASAGSDVEERRVSIPLLPVDRLPAVLELLLPGSSDVPDLVAAPPAARRRAVTRASWPAALVALAASVLAFPEGLAALVLVPLAVGFGLLAHRGLGHAVGPAHVVARRGALVRRTVAVPLVRAQSTRVRSTPFQRRLGLATCHVDVAGPGRRPAVVDVAVADAEHVAGRAVAAVAGR